MKNKKLTFELEDEGNGDCLKKITSLNAVGSERSKI